MGALRVCLLVVAAAVIEEAFCRSPVPSNYGNCYDRSPPSVCADLMMKYSCNNQHVRYQCRGTCKVCKPATCKSVRCIGGRICVEGNGKAECKFPDCRRQKCPSGQECKRQTNGRYSCQDVDECINVTNPCGEGGTCTNSPGSFSCACAPGFSLNAKKVCEDIDECKIQHVRGPCGDGGKCTNSPGSFTCTCEPGYSLNAQKFCEKVANECTKFPGACGPGQCVPLEKGGYMCKCNDGYMLSEGKLCVDIDECNRAEGLPVCGIGVKCVNTPGSFTCSCDLGFTLTNVCLAKSQEGMSLKDLKDKLLEQGFTEPEPNNSVSEGVANLIKGTSKQCSGALDIVFLIDWSFSIRQEESKLALQFLVNLTRNFHSKKANVKISAAFFNNAFKREFCFNDFACNEDAAKALEKSKKLRRGSTRATFALEKTTMSVLKNKECGSRDGARKVVLIAWDRRPNWADAFYERVRTMKQEGVDVTNLRVGPPTSLMEQSEEDLMDYVDILDYQSLDTKVDEVANKLCKKARR